MIKPVSDEAVQIWNQPDDMIAQWAESPSKLRIENMVADWIGYVDTIADLGCGCGRYADVLSCEEYYGFDQSIPMIDRAKSSMPMLSRTLSGTEFACVDIFSYSSGRTYDVVVMMDVVQHQNEPIASVRRMMELWVADRYVLSLLVGDVREELSMSVVEPYSNLLCLLDTAVLERMHVERVGNEHFSTVVLELLCG